jgi:integrase
LKSRPLPSWDVEFWPDLFPKEIGDLTAYRTSVKSSHSGRWVSFGKHGWVISRERRSGLKRLQAFLTSKAATFSRSVVAHLHWDLRGMFRLAVAEGYIDRDPTGALYTPKEAKVAATRVMNRKEAEQHINALDLRERVIDHLAMFVGMRPGEILGLQRRHVAGDCSEVVIEQRLYRGDIDDPKTTSSRRTVGIPSQTARELREWMELVGTQPEAWVFASENPAKPMWRDNVWYRNMKPKLDLIGLGWANFQVIRRTHASLGHDHPPESRCVSGRRAPADAGALVGQSGPDPVR